MNPAEWTPEQWWDVLKTAAGLLLSGIVIPFARKAVREAREAKLAAQQTQAQTSSERHVDGQLTTVSNATQLEEVVGAQDDLRAAHAATDGKVESLTETIGRMAIELAQQRGSGTRRLPTEEVPAWTASQRPGRQSSEPPSPALPSPSSPSATTAPSIPSSGSSSESPSSPEERRSGPSLTRSVPLPREGGN